MKVLAIAALAVVGCGKQPDRARSVPSDMPPEIAAWMPADPALPFVGSWAGRLTIPIDGKSSMSIAGNPVAVAFAPDHSKATVFDGKRDRTFGFVVETPCQAGFTDTKPSGSIYRYPVTFITRGGKLEIGGGNAGARKGKAAVVCDAEGVVVVGDKGTCQRWRTHLEWEAKPATCAWSQRDGKDVLTVDRSTYTADGDVLATDSWPALAWKPTDDAGARATVLAEIAKHDPAEQAKAAGGKVGDTTTVAGLIVTYAADKAAWKGKQVEVTALYLNQNVSTSGGKQHINAIVVDHKGDKPSLTCDDLAQEPKGLVQYDKVTVKGTVGESFDQAALAGCEIAKAP